VLREHEPSPSSARELSDSVRTTPLFALASDRDLKCDFCRWNRATLSAFAGAVPARAQRRAGGAAEDARPGAAADPRPGAAAEGAQGGGGLQNVGEAGGRATREEEEGGSA